MDTQRKLETIAERVLPELPVSAALADRSLFLARVMAVGTWGETQIVLDHFGEQAARDVLDNPPVKVFDRESWNYWRRLFGMDASVRPPTFYTTYPWLRGRGGPKPSATARIIDHAPTQRLNAVGASPNFPSVSAAGFDS